MVKHAFKIAKLITLIGTGAGGGTGTGGGTGAGAGAGVCGSWILDARLSTVLHSLSSWLSKPYNLSDTCLFPCISKSIKVQVVT